VGVVGVVVVVGAGVVVVPGVVVVAGAVVVVGVVVVVPPPAAARTVPYIDQCDGVVFGELLNVAGRAPYVNE
jgi:hypothetical protein